MHMYRYTYIHSIALHPQALTQALTSQVKPLPEWKLSSALRPSVPVRGLERCVLGGYPKPIGSDPTFLFTYFFIWQILTIKLDAFNKGWV